MGRLEPLLNRLDASAKERGDEFERLCKWFLENDPIYATQLEKVWLWDEWPDRWGPDAGIDLVARSRQGELWAIQTKHYAPESTVSKADIDSFLSESSRPGFAFRLLIATTDRLSANAKRTLAGQKVPAQALLRSQLVERELVWPDRIGQKPKRRKPYTPRPHQKAAIKDVTKGFTEADRGQLIMACGTGKTLTSLFIAEKLAAKRVLVLVPSLSLLSQTLSEWTANAKKPIEFLPVCSDATVAEKDAAVESTSELGFPVTTDPGEIATFVRRRGDTMRVVFATYQSSDRIKAAQKLSRVPKFDLVIADEAHRCTGNTTSDFATVLDAGKIRAERRLFMTATPRILSARAKRAALEADVEFASMDDEDTFGPEFHRLTFATAIEQKLLADYQVVILGVDNEEVLKAVQERQFVTTNGKDIISADRLGAAVGLAKAIRKYGLTRVITFHGRVKAASNFADTFPAILDWMPARQRPKGTTETNFVSGEMSAGERKRALHHLKTSEADQVILANARVLTEGIDVPDLDGVAFMDPRNSEVDIVQAVGRAIRKPRGKNKDKIGTIVLPIVIKQTEDAEEELDRSDYKAIWAVLRALRAHDERLAEEIDRLRQKLGRTGQIGLSAMPDRVTIDLPSRVSSVFATAMAAQLVRVSSSAWEEGYGRLKVFAAQYGHARPQNGLIVDGFRLGQWVATQRGAYSEMSALRRSRLEELPGWIWNALEFRWDEWFAHLEAFVSNYGHARPSTGLRVGEHRLGQWVAFLRTTRETISPDRRERLESLPGWTWTVQSTAWETGFRHLEDFVAKHGHASPAQSLVVNGYRLGQWVSAQRSARNRLGAERKRRLDGLEGWTWNATEDVWEAGFEHLQKFVAEFGHARPTRHCEFAGFKLGDWVVRQRTGYDALTSSRRRRLEALPGWAWNPFGSTWEVGYGHLQDFVALTGHARPTKTEEFRGFRLGQWVSVQRRDIDRMSPDRRERLESLPGWTWTVRSTAWETGFRHLEDFVAKHGHASPAQSLVVNGYRLGQWVSVQRSRRDAMELVRQERLEALPGWVWDARPRE
jgi:superfamily II DNA or RNA helicase